MKRIVVVSLLAVTLSAGMLWGATQVLAKDANEAPYASLVQKIADKFNLNKSDVQAVFDEHYQEQRAKMEAKFADRLDQLVNDGKITEAQKQLIIAKHKELEASRQSMFESMKDKTPEERKTAMEAERKALEDWAKQNNIDLKYVMPGHGMGKGMGMRGFGHHGQDDVSSPTPTQ
jgi:hypothetical protein